MLIFYKLLTYPNQIQLQYNVKEKKYMYFLLTQPISNLIIKIKQS